MKFDIRMIFYMLVTWCIWYFNEIPYIYGFIVYIAIISTHLFKRKDFSDVPIIVLFSIMALRLDPEVSHFTIDYGLIVLLVFYTLYQCIKNKTIYIGSLLIPLGIYLAYNFISILWTPDKLDGFYGALGMLQGYLMYFILTNNKLKINKDSLFKISKAATYLMLTLSGEILFIYFKHGFKYVLEHKNLVHLGWSYSNLLAVIFVFLLPIAFYKYIKSDKWHPIYFLLDIISLVSLFLTLSRGAILGIILPLALFTIFYVRKKMIVRYGSIFVALTILVITIKPLYSFFFKLTERISIKGFDDSNRFPLYEIGLESFLDRPLFGNGVKSSTYLIRHLLEGRTNHFIHNMILQIALTLGIVGLIIFFYLVYKWIKILYKPKDVFVVCVVLGIFGELIHQMLDVSFDLLFFGVYFYTLIAMVEIYCHHLDDKIKIKKLTFNKAKKSTSKI